MPIPNGLHLKSADKISRHTLGNALGFNNRQAFGGGLCFYPKHQQLEVTLLWACIDLPPKLFLGVGFPPAFKKAIIPKVNLDTVNKKVALNQSILRKSRREKEFVVSRPWKRVSRRERNEKVIYTHGHPTTTSPFSRVPSDEISSVMEICWYYIFPLFGACHIICLICDSHLRILTWQMLQVKRTASEQRHLWTF